MERKEMKWIEKKWKEGKGKERGKEWIGEKRWGNLWKEMRRNEINWNCFTQYIESMGMDNQKKGKQ